MPIGIGATPSTSPLERTQSALHKTFRQLSTFKRITRASDDAAALAISENLRATERALQQGQRNLSDGISLAQTAEGGMSEISSNLIRLRELAVQAGNGAIGAQGQAAIQSEFDSLSQEITRAAEATQFAGRSLLNGEAQGANAVNLRDGTGGEVIQIEVGDVRASTLGVEGLVASDPGAIDAIDAALAHVGRERSELGATQSRLESGIRNLRNAESSTAAANSRLADADIAQVSADSTALQIKQRIQIAIQSQGRISQEAVLRLLG